MLFSRSMFFASAVALTALSTATPSNAEQLAFDTKRSEVRFVYQMGLATQRGKFATVDGVVEFNDKAPEQSKVRAVIASASLATGQPIVDSELKGRGFFNVEAAPTITFASNAVKSTGESTAEVSGDITINGITRPIVLQVEIVPRDDPALKYDVGVRQFIGKTRIQRSEFGMTSYASMVSDEIDVEIHAIVRPKRRPS